jgi:hypothetical protein
MLKFEVFEKGTDSNSPAVVDYPETTQIASQFIDYQLWQTFRELKVAYVQQQLHFRPDIRMQLAQLLIGKSHSRMDRPSSFDGVWRLPKIGAKISQKAL